MIYFLIIFSFIFSFGVQSFSLPHNALEISNSNSGIGNSNNININAAGINNIQNTVSFSSISWYQGVRGSNIDFKWGKKKHHYINLYNLSANNIELRDLVPNDNPIGVFDIHHISLSYGFGTHVSDKLNIGVKTNLSYNQLYVDESYGYHINLGASYLYNKFLSFGISVQQLGLEKYNNTNHTYPLLAGIGTSINLNKLKTQINTDIILQEELDNPLSLNVSSISRFNSFSIITGYHFNEDKQEFSCGFSFKYRKIEFDYGIGFHNNLDFPIIFSFKYHI